VNFKKINESQENTEKQLNKLRKKIQSMNEKFNKERDLKKKNRNCA
jgi:hypothetical protein